METRDLALFLHILTLLAAIGLGSILHAAEWQARSATTTGELRTLSRPYAWAKLFPLLILLLFGTGAWLVHLDQPAYDWDSPWVWTAIVSLVVLLVSGGAILSRHAKHYGAMLAQAPDGPITPELRAAAFDRTAWATSHMNTALAVSVVLNMVNKPDDAATAVITNVAGFAIGVGIGLVGARGRG
jgi:hypothetical protein